MQCNKKLALAVLLCLLTVVPLAKTVSPSQELRNAEVLSRIVLMPDPDTDLVVPKLELELLANGGRKISSDLPLGPGKVKAELGVAVDPGAMTYRVFHLRNEEDESRFEAFTKTPGIFVPKRQSALSFEDPFPGRARNFGCPDCWGDYGGHVRTVDIPQLELTKTWVTLYFNSQPKQPPSPGECDWSADGNGGCFAGRYPISNWFNTWCYGSRPGPPFNPFWSESIQEGTYYNNDFLGGACGTTNVYQRAMLYTIPTAVYFSWQHSDSGSCSYLIFARVGWQGVSTCFY